MLRHPRHLVSLLVLALAAGACGAAGDDDGDAGGQPDGGLAVVATTSIYGDLVRTLLADDGSVEILIQPGQDPHGYAPSAQQAAALRDADLVVANGLDLEEQLVDVLADAEEDGVAVVRVAEEVAPVAHEGAGPDHDDHGDEDDGDDGDGASDATEALDPHVWLDPLRMATAAELLAERLAQVDDQLEDAEWTARGAALGDRLRGVSDEASSILDVVPAGCRTLVTDHRSLGYFADRFDLEVVGSVVPGTSSQAEPSARDFAALVDTVRERDIPAVFSDTSASDDLAQALAAEVGRDVEVVALYTESLGEPGSGAETYPGLILTDARLIADALADC
jgi:zinc/manganese transport system substrate-binding protein